MSLRLIRRVALAPTVILTVGACFATRGDVRILQNDISRVQSELEATRAASAARDSALHRSLDSALANVVRTLASVNDTVRSMHATTMRLRGDVREDLTAIRQQLITVEERVGASAKRIQDLRADLEADAADRAATPPAGRDSTKPPVAGAAPAAAAAPGPAQLNQMGQDQMRRGSYAVARGAFNELLTKHPTSDLAPEALYGIAESYNFEGNGVAADSVWALVVSRYPTSDRAPTALYKRATALRAVGQTDRARVLYQQVVDKYPRTDAAVLAQDFLTKKP